MRKRFEMLEEATGRINGQPFIKHGEAIHAANMAALQKIRGNSLPNTPQEEKHLRHIAAMPNSRKRGI